MSERRDEQQDRRKVRTGPLIAVLAVMVVTLLAVVGMMAGRLFFGDNEDPTTQPTETASSTPPPSTKPVVREDLHVVVGEGGSAVSEFDPTVPVGYEPTCKGAVEAATNYLIALDYTKATSRDVSPDKFVELTRELTTGDYQSSAVASTEEMLNQFGEAESPRGSVRPDWGGFTLVECTEGKSATVTIVSAADYAGTGDFYYASLSTSLTWVDNDWKISDTAPGESPTTLPPDPATTPDKQVLTLIGTHTQWENYEDAS